MTYRPIRNAAATWLAAGLWLAACGGEEEGDKTSGDKGGDCKDGKTQSCDCPDNGKSGKQSCEDGEWGDCNCSGAKADGGSSTRDGGKDANVGSQSNALKVPCAVQEIFNAKCSDCHGTVTDFAAPMSLVTYDDVMAPGPKTKTKKVYELVTDRIHDVASPMPPKDRKDLTLTDDEKAALDAWVESGAKPRAADDKCTTPDPEPKPAKDGGAEQSVEDKYKDLHGPADCEEEYSFQAHDVNDVNKPYLLNAATNLEGTVDKYICFYFKPPYTAESQGLWFASMLDKTPVLHHWLLYGTDTATHPDGSVSGCSAAEPGAYLLAGWAPGADDVTMPKDIGLDLPSGPTAGLILEVHYYNTTKAEVLDRTGMRLCTAKANTRPKTAAVHFTGTEGICVPPGAKGYSTTGICEPRRDQGDIHIIQVWPHMHKLGKRMRVTIKRANGTSEPLNDEPFNFNNQYKFPKDDIILKPGDTIETTCFYDNDTAGAVPFGEKTSNEMCYGFITAWPMGALMTDPARLNPIQNIGLGIQPTRRCMDPVSIFGSCNQLADYPF